MSKHIYAFGGGSAEGEGSQKDLLGGKGAGLAAMSRLGIPVPPGFTLTTEVCTFYQEHGGGYPDGLEAELEAHLRRVEEMLGQRFGDPQDPLLFSVRSGAPRSMPGMMDTILNLGLNDAIAASWIARGADARFVWDAYRRLLTMYGDVVMGVPHHDFEALLSAARKAEGAATDADLSAGALAALAPQYQALIEKVAGRPFPQDPRQQLWGSVAAVFQSWNNPRARDYRRLEKIPDHPGTGVNVQAMVFGNRGTDCATGVAFTRNPATGERKFFGEYLINAQGEDVVAGIRTPKPVEGANGDGLAKDFPQAWRDLQEVSATLEHNFRDMQDIEFTIQHGRLFMLQTRTGKRTGASAVRIAVEMVGEGLIDRKTAIQRVEPQHLVQVLAPEFDGKEKGRADLLAHGLPAGPGAASGRIALNAERAAQMAAESLATSPVLLVRAETSPEDIVGMHASAGILTSRGGMTSHAAVVARGLGKPCVVGAGDLDVDERAGEVRVKGRVFREGDALSIDGTTGEVLAGALATHPSEVLLSLQDGTAAITPGAKAFRQILEWADGERRLRVRANADTPHDARVASAMGAQGIGLCRTEHMFFADERIPWVRRMILAKDDAERAEALARLLPMQQKDFEGIFAALPGLPITIRLLDPPLHEFLPHGEKALRQLAGQMGIDPAALEARSEALAESNPMLGLRGCRLGLTSPEIYDMQVQAIVRAACVRVKAGDAVQPEIMMPLVGTEEEMKRLRQRTSDICAGILKEEGIDLAIPIGTMIEVPRAALVADQIARQADFFSFGTNDLTQMTYGYSRDDAGRFLPHYIESKILAGDPFQSIDTEGVGQLVAMACEKGRRGHPHLHLGVCGEHGGDPDSIAFFDRTGLDYVSCSPYRVPIARLAAARSALQQAAAKDKEKAKTGPTAAAVPGSLPMAAAP